MIYPINSETIPVNDLTLIEIHRTNSEKTVGLIKLTERTNNNEAMLGKVIRVGHIIANTGYIKPGDWMLIDKFSLFCKPSLETGSLALVPSGGIIALVEVDDPSKKISTTA